MKRFIILIALLLPLACAARQLRPLVWVLDAGHGGKDQGTSLNKVLEKDLTLQLTNRVAALIRKNKPGIKVVLTRTDDTFVSLEDRCKIASKARADQPTAGMVAAEQLLQLGSSGRPWCTCQQSVCTDACRDACRPH